MKINNKKEADRAIKEVAKYLSNAEETSEYGTNELETADTAREYSYKLLKATDADGKCGCPLCRS